MGTWWNVSRRGALFLAAYYMSNAVFQGYISLYYQSLAFSDAQLGLLTSALPLVSIVSMQIWGRIGDAVQRKRWLIAGMAFVAALCIVLFFLVGARFWALFAGVCTFAFFFTSIQPMGDAVILEALNAEKRPYGPVRLAGGVAFALTSLAMGRLLEGEGHETRVLYAAASLLTVTAWSALLLPDHALPVTKTARSRGKGMITLLKNAELRRLMGMVLLLQVSLGYFYAFFSPFFTVNLGGSGTQLGWCYFISATSEIPFLLQSDRLFEKHGAGRLLCVSAAMLGVRWLLLAVTKSVYVAMMSQLFHSMGFIVIAVATAKYIQRAVPETMRASGQLLASVVGFGLARVVGYYGGGLLSDHLGRQPVFFITSALCLMALVFYGPYYAKHPPLNGGN